MVLSAVFSFAARLLLATAAVAGTAIPTVRLRNGVRMPLLAAGVGGFSDRAANASILSALGLGITSIDTAHDYANFAGVEAALRTTPVRREDYFYAYSSFLTRAQHKRFIGGYRRRMNAALA